MPIPKPVRPARRPHPVWQLLALTFGGSIIAHVFEIESSAAEQLNAAVERALSAMREVTELLAAEVLDTCRDAQLPELMKTLDEITDRSSAAGSVVLARVDRSGVVRAAGFLSTRAWMDAHLRNPRRENAHLLRTSRLLNRSYPATQRAWLNYQISRAHADVIANGIESAVKGLDADLRDQARIDAEQVLLDISHDYSADHARVAATRIRLAADPDGAKAAAMEADGRQWFSLTPVSEGWLCKGWFDNVTGSALATVLEGRRNSRHHSGEAASAFDVSSIVDESYAYEEAAKRVRHENALVLGEIAHELLNSGRSGTVNSERPHLEMSVSLAELVSETGYGELLIPGAPRLMRSAPVDIGTIRQLSCDAQVRRVVSSGTFRDPDSGDELNSAIGRMLAAPTEVVDYGRAHRIVPPGLKRRIALRDQGCVFPGCNRPPSMTEAHHIIHWSQGGPTDLNNLALVCVRHHTDVHSRGWKLVPRAGMEPHQPGYWEVHPPRPPTWADTG